MASEDIEIAVQRTLCLPEIVADIVYHRADNLASLNAVFRVNSLWAAITRPLLWRCLPAEALGVVPAARRHVYDSAIRGFEVHEWPQRLRYPQVWMLPNIRSLSLTYAGATALADAAMHFAASVDGFASTLTSVSLRYLPADTPMLRALSRGKRIAAALSCAPGSGGVGGDAVGVRSRSDSLEDRATLHFLACLARCANLRQLALSPSFTPVTARPVTEWGREALFVRLSDLDVTALGAAIAPLCQWRRSIMRLHVTLEHSSFDGSAFKSIARLTPLRSLAVAEHGIASDAMMQAVMQLGCPQVLVALDRRFGILIDFVDLMSAQQGDEGLC